MPERGEDEALRWSGNRYYQSILRVLGHVQANLDRELPLEELARVAGFSSFHFHRIFTGMVGESVKAYVRRLRLERAAHRLKYGDAALVDIALDAGYEAQESFTRAFKAAFDEPPGQFRRRHRPVPRISAPSRVHYSPSEEVEAFSPQTKGERELMEIKIENRPAMRAVCLRHVGPYEQVGRVWGQLCGFVASAGLMGTSARMFGLSYDDPEVTAPEKLRYDACVEMLGELEVEAPFHVQEVRGGEYAVAVHEGPYENLARTYEAIFGVWLPASGRELSKDPCVEIYLNDPGSTPAEELRTEVCVPLAGSG